MIAVVIVINAVYALPMTKMNEEDLVDPSWRRREIDGWYSTIETLWPGQPPLDDEGFATLARRTLWAGRETVRMLRKPAQPFFSRLHLNQQWGLFAVVTEAPDRLVIEVRRQPTKEWETLYSRLDGEHDWHDPQLRYRRIRGVWDGVRDEPKGTYKRLTTWIARTVFEEQPDVDRVRVVLQRHFERLPWREPNPEIKRRAERYHRREELMK